MMLYLVRLCPFCGHCKENRDLTIFNLFCSPLDIFRKDSITWQLVSRVNENKDMYNGLILAMPLRITAEFEEREMKKRGPSYLS